MQALENLAAAHIPVALGPLPPSGRKPIMKLVGHTILLGKFAQVELLPDPLS